jgi:amino acid transporter
VKAEPPERGRSWAPLDFGVYSFLAVNPLALGLWMFSLAPLVGGNLFVATVLTAVVMFLGAVVFGALAESRPWSGGDYAWQTRLLDRRVGAVLTLTSWWLVVVALAPVYGNLFRMEVIDPILTTLGWEDLASWFGGRNGIFVSSLVAISVATAFVGLGMRRAAIVQRVLLAIGIVALVAVLALFFTHGPNEFSRAFNEQAAETYGTGHIVSTQIEQNGDLDAEAGELEFGGSLGLVPLVLLFALWIGWAGPLAGEVRGWRPQLGRAVLVRTVVAWTMTCLLLFVAIGKSMTWELWNEANNLYWGTVYGTTSPTPLPAWPNPVLFASWLTDSTAFRVLLLAGMGAWIVGFAATLFLGASRILLAGAADGLLPRRFASTSRNAVPVATLALLVVPACALAALDAYWDMFASWTAAGVVALALTTLGSALAAAKAFRRDNTGVAVIALVFASVVGLVVGDWVLDPVYGIRAVGPIVFLAALYVLACGAYALSRRRRAAV